MFHQMAAAKDPDVAFFKKLDGFQPCEITELKAGNHFFAVYGQFQTSAPIATNEKTSTSSFMCLLFLTVLIDETRES